MNENINKDSRELESSDAGGGIKRKDSKLDKNKIATWCGFGGGGIFFILNLATKGAVPGGFKGGVLGFIVGYGLAWLVLAFVPNK